jgi:hypothetical protein
MQQPSTSLPCDAPSLMLTTVIAYLTETTKDITPDQLSAHLGVPGSWIRAIRENRSSKPNINRIEYIFREFCGGRVSGPSKTV